MLFPFSLATVKPFKVTLKTTENQVIYRRYGSRAELVYWENGEYQQYNYNNLKLVDEPRISNPDFTVTYYFPSLDRGGFSRCSTLPPFNNDYYEVYSAEMTNVSYQYIKNKNGEEFSFTSEYGRTCKLTVCMKNLRERPFTYYDETTNLASNCFRVSEDIFEISLRRTSEMTKESFETVELPKFYAAYDENTALLVNIWRYA